VFGGGGGLLGGGLGGFGGGVGPGVGGGKGPADFTLRLFLPEQAVTPEGKVVKLAPAPLTAKGLEHLKALAGRLEHLTLCSGKLTDADLRHLGELKSLKKLALRAPEVTGKGLAHLTGLKRLEVLDLRGTRAVSGMAALRALPKLRVLYANLAPSDPRYKAKYAEYRRLLPRVTVVPLWQPSGPGAGGGFGGP
jgi:hypothetical protein